uniref:Tryptophanyl tRNA synthetase 2, mitochondrial n=1 Tax=Oncorhynchus mykiss TaxID=8022 RepID=A0A8K9X996_ONCMY
PLFRAWPRRYVFSGIQPTSVPHLGNYLGALKSWVSLQSQYPSVLYSIVDLHSITQSQDLALLRVNTLVMVASLLACGIETSILFQQSQVSEHTELSWILGCLASIPPTQTPASMKSKQKNEGSAADILLYNELLSSHRRSNPSATPPRCPSQTPRRWPPSTSLTRPTTSSSKSAVPSDFTFVVTFDPAARLGVSNLVLMHAAGCTVEEAVGLDTGKYKQLVAEAMEVRCNTLLSRSICAEIRFTLLQHGSHRTFICISFFVNDIHKTLLMSKWKKYFNMYFF